jgi:putative acetyltransferase
MLQLIKTDGLKKDFIELIQLLDKDLAIRDGDDHQFYAQYNKIAKLNYCIVAYFEGKPVGSGALKEYDSITMEVKRMYCVEESRGKGIATAVLQALESWAKELGYKYCILETGHKQPEAIALYKKNNYAVIPNYGQYAAVYNSVCFKKQLLRDCIFNEF